jgi:4-amino-4-deoxy-L-arabinose transferase-like glycosyltransferase
MAFFGPGEVQIAAYPLLTSVVMIVLIYLITARMFGHQAARIASIIWVFLPMEIELATMLYPEVPTTAFAFIGIYCIYIARSRDGIGQRAQLLHGLAGGLAFGASWLCKESVVYFVPFCLALILFDLRKTGFKHLAMWGGIAAGSLAVLIGEMFVYGIINGDLLYRFNAIHNNYRLYPEYFFTEGARFGYEEGTPFWKGVIKRIAIDGPALIFLTAHFLFLPSFGAIAALHGLYRRDSRFYFMAALFVVLVIMFNGFSDVCAGFILSCASRRAPGEFGAHRRVITSLGIVFQHHSERHTNSIGWPPTELRPLHYNRSTVPGKTFYIETFGCQMNAHDSEKVVGTLVSGMSERVSQPHSM